MVTWRLRVLATLAATLLTLLLLELGGALLFRPLNGEPYQRAHLAHWLQSRLDALAARRSETSSELLYRFHPYVGYVGRPGMRPWPEPYPPFNDHGMLTAAGRAYPYQPTPEDLVIAVLGGSVAEGFANLGGEAALQAALEALRPDWNRRVVLISLATGGYKQPQQLFHLQTALLSGFQFHGVFNLDGLNELVAVGHNLAQGVHPLYPSSLHSAMMAAAYQGHAMDPGIAEIVVRSHQLRQREQWLLGFVQGSSLRYSRFAMLLAKLWSRSTEQQLATLLNTATGTAERAMIADFRGPPMGAVDDPHAYAATLWAESSRLLHAVAQRFDLAYLHGLQPNQYVPNSKALSEEELRQAYAPDSDIARAVREGYPQLQAAGQGLLAEGVAFMDLSQVFVDYPGTLYWDICCHFNQTGNALIAQAIAAPLLDLLDAAPP